MGKSVGFFKRNKNVDKIGSLNKISGHVSKMFENIKLTEQSSSASRTPMDEHMGKFALERKKEMERLQKIMKTEPKGPTLRGEPKVLTGLRYDPNTDGKLAELKKKVKPKGAFPKPSEEYQKLYRKHMLPKHGIPKPGAAMDLLNEWAKVRQSKL